MKSPNRLPVGTNPRGKPKGGKGATRIIPKRVDKKVEVSFSEEQVNLLKDRYGNNLKMKKIRLFVWDTPPIKISVTEFIVQRVYLGKKLIAQATHPELPKRGIFGNNLHSLIITQKNGFAGSCEKVRDFIEDLTGESFSPQAIKDCVHRTGKELEPAYNDLGRELRDSESVGVDESPWRNNGKNWQLWLFCTLNIVFITIENSRGRKIVNKVLGSIFEGAITSDCLGVYQKCAWYYQKCWAHLLRATYNLADRNRNDIKKLHRWLSHLFEEMKEFLKSNPGLYERMQKHEEFDKELKKIMNYKWKSEEAKGIIKNRLKAFEGHWLTAILIPEVELTNNRTERDIRKTMPTKKLLGGHRTDKGAKYFAIIESLRLTWKVQGKSPYQELINKFEEINGNLPL